MRGPVNGPAVRGALPKRMPDLASQGFNSPNARLADGRPGWICGSNPRLSMRLRFGKNQQSESCQDSKSNPERARARRFVPAPAERLRPDPARASATSCLAGGRIPLTACKSPEKNSPGCDTRQLQALCRSKRRGRAAQATQIILKRGNRYEDDYYGE